MTDISRIEPADRRIERKAVSMLLVACLVWGMGFNWNKEAQALLGSRLAAISGEPSMSDLGPAWFLAIRFPLATLGWILVFPRSLRGWSWTTIRGGVAGGTCLAVGTLLQHYGLAHTSESLRAFLTSLTILFTPLMAVLFFRQRVGGWMWIAIACATIGITLMTLYRQEAGFDRGALLGFLCAVVFSLLILVIDRFGRREDSYRFTLAQFITASVVFLTFSVVWHVLRDPRGILDVARATASAPLLGWLALTIGLGTLLTFGLMYRFQPQTTATRAALIYLSEPVFATVYAWWAADSPISAAAIIGAAMILFGNSLAELAARRSSPQPI